MEFECWNTLEPIRLTSADVRAAFLWRRKNGSLASRAPELFLPSAHALRLRVDLSDILTPLDALNLNGFRLVRSGQPSCSARISQITRLGGKIVKNDAFESEEDVVSLLVHEFLDAISQRFADLCRYPGFLAKEERPPVVYSTSLVERLVIGALVAPRQPRLAPLLILPSEADVFRALRDSVEDHLPFFLENASDTFSVTSAEGRFHMQVTGERGEKLEDFSSSELPKVVLGFVRSLFGFQRMENDDDWTFDPASLAG